MRLLQFGFAAALITAASHPADSQTLSEPPPLTYADVADLALPAPVAAHVRVRRARTLRERDVAGVPPGHRRFLIEADVIALIRGAGGLPPRISYLVDLPDDARGRGARIRRNSEYLIFAIPNPGEPDELRLVAPDAQIPFTPAHADQVRAILSQAVRTDAPPSVTGIGRAFHVPGALPGESETQIFLETAGGGPISLNVFRRPGERPRWAVALGEVVEASAAAPRPQSLLWYRLACFLPQGVPDESVSDSGPGEAAAIRQDYRFVLESLGPCRRNRRQF